MNMDNAALVSLVLVFVVGFFAWQWWSRSGSASAAGRKAPVRPAEPPAAAPVAAAAPARPAAAAPPQEESYPEVAGQSEADLRAKEPLQQAPSAAAARMPVDGAARLGPVPVENNLRHPEQSFHQPAPQQSPQPSEVAAGRAAIASTPGMAVNVQQFTPEMAQNGGAVVGNSVFAFDGMEPTGFAAF